MKEAISIESTIKKTTSEASTIVFEGLKPTAGVIVDLLARKFGGPSSKLRPLFGRYHAPALKRIQERREKYPSSVIA